jgi:hypothetical protein
VLFVICHIAENGLPMGDDDDLDPEVFEAGEKGPRTDLDGPGSPPAPQHPRL